MLIAFCGIDGSGKTTQLVELEKVLKENDYSVYRTKQPTNWYRSDERVRKILNQECIDDMLNKELALFAATDRLRHIQTEIIPQEKRGQVVITDRYVFSTYAYFMARGIDDFKWLHELNRFVPMPDITFYIDIDVKTALQRIIARDGKATKKEETDFNTMSKVREVFLQQPWGKIQDYYILDGTNSIKENAENVKKIVFEKLLANKNIISSKITI